MSIIWTLRKAHMTIKEFISLEEQIHRWVAGESVHRLIDKPRFKGDDGECCPDFSCCRPELLQPVEIRKAFATASDKERNKFLGAFLGAMLQKCFSEEKVYIAGRDSAEES